MSNVTTFKSEGYFVGLGAPSANMFIPAGALYVDRETGVAYTFSDGNWNPIGGGGGSLPLQVAADGDSVLLNAASDVVMSVDANGNPLVASTDGSLFGFSPGGSASLYSAIADASLILDANGNVTIERNAQVLGAGLAASLTTYLGVPNADLTWTASSVGQAVNSLQIEYVDPGTPSASLSASYAAPVLTINLATGVDVGPIGTSTINAGGTGWANGNTAFPLAGGGLTINAVNQGTKTFTFDSLPASAGSVVGYLLISGSTGNNGVYSVNNIVGLGVTVNEAIPSPVADGTAVYGSALLTVTGVTTGTIDTYDLTAAGAGYQVDTNIPIVAVTGVGIDASIDIASLDGPIAAITTTAQDIIDLGSYDSAPVTVTLAPGSDGSGIVTALSPTNLSGGLVALNVTGSSSLDNGAITTSGDGAAYFDSSISIGPTVTAGTGPSYFINNSSGLGVYDPDNADKDTDIAAQGAGTINLNSPVLASALPTSDPAVAGALWVDPAGGLYIVKVSQG